MVVVKPPFWVRTVFSRYLWRINNKEKAVYLTFDDGPTPRVTNWVLDCLDKFDAKATFFCIGRNVDRDGAIYKDILERGHLVGNHTYSHLNGLKTKNKIYLEDIDLAAQHVKSNIFRPPYGMIKKSQGRAVSKKFKVVMWDILSYDFSQTISPQKCLDNVIGKVRSGSVIVFHDSEKAWKNLEYALPLTLKFLKEKGYVMKPIKT